MSPTSKICDLYYFAGRANELFLLRDRVAELEEQLGLSRDLRLALTLQGFTRGEAAFCTVVFKRQGVAPREYIYSVMYGSTHESEQPEIKIIDVWACKARAKLRRHDIAVGTAWGVGFFFDTDNKRKLAELIARVDMGASDVSG